MDIKQVLSEMTLEEKALLCSGFGRWHTKEITRLRVMSVMMADGPHGLRKEKTDDSNSIIKDSYPSTCFPTASALAATWDRDLIFKVGEALGEECRQEKVGVRPRSARRSQPSGRSRGGDSRPGRLASGWGHRVAQRAGAFAGRGSRFAITNSGRAARTVAGHESWPI